MILSESSIYELYITATIKAEQYITKLGKEECDRSVTSNVICLNLVLKNICILTPIQLKPNQSQFFVYLFFY